MLLSHCLKRTSLVWFRTGNIGPTHILHAAIATWDGGLKMAICMVITPLTWDRTSTILALYIHLPTSQVELPRSSTRFQRQAAEIDGMPSGYDPRAVLEMQYSKHTPNSSRMASGYHQFTFISWDKLGYGSPTTMVVSIYLVHLERWYFFCEYQEHYPILPTDATILYTHTHT